MAQRGLIKLPDFPRIERQGKPLDLNFPETRILNPQIYTNSIPPLIFNLNANPPTRKSVFEVLFFQGEKNSRNFTQLLSKVGTYTQKFVWLKQIFSLTIFVWFKQIFCSKLAIFLFKLLFTRFYSYTEKNSSRNFTQLLSKVETYTQKKVSFIQINISLNQNNLCIALWSNKSFFDSKEFIDCFFSLN